MKSKIIEIHDISDTAAIRNVARLLDEGALVAIPTDTVYGIASRVQSDTITRLSRIKGRDASKHYTLHVGSPDQLRYYVPRMSLQAGKLVQKGLPGPLTIVFEMNHASLSELKKKLSPEVFNLLYSDETIGLRYPDHAIVCEILSQTKSPVVVPSANPAGRSPAVTVQEVIDYFPEEIDYVVNTPTQMLEHNYNSTVIKAGRKGVEVLREGVIPEDVIREWAAFQVLFVCTGNTCRSPMAEGIFQKHLANILGSSVDELSKIGYKILSAGIAAFDGSSVSENSVIVCRENGIDIEDFRSQILSHKLIAESDLIFTMTQSHRNMVLELMPEAANKTMNLISDKDISDPVGFGVNLYRQCFKEIQQAILKRIGELL